VAELCKAYLQIAEGNADEYLTAIIQPGFDPTELGHWLREIVDRDQIDIVLMEAASVGEHNLQSVARALAEFAGHHRLPDADECTSVHKCNAGPYRRAAAVWLDLGFYQNGRKFRELTPYVG
jgi:hypothetical protein